MGILAIGGTGNAGVQLLAPETVSNLLAWYSGDSVGGVADGDGVPLWKDRSINHHDLVQAVGSKQPLLALNQLNGHPVLKFDGVSMILQTADTFSFAQPVTIFLVMYDRASENGYYFVDGKPGNQILLFKSSTYTDSIRMYAGASGPDAGPNTMEGFRVVTASFNGATSDLRINGVAQNANGLYDAGTNGATGLTIGGTGNDAYWTHFDVAEFLVYTKAVAGTERDAIEAYLTAKYAIA